MKAEPRETTIHDITEAMLAETGHGPLHLSDGVHFWRDREGIHLAITEGPDRRVLRHYIFDKSSWASAVAFTTPEGETGVTFRIADALLGH